MINDVNCPYCDSPQEINHDDGYGYEEDRTHNQQCSMCDKYFVYTTSILYSYYPEKADCLNGSDHKWNPTHTFPKKFTEMICDMCGERRQPTEKEIEDILSNAK